MNFLHSPNDLSLQQGAEEYSHCLPCSLLEYYKLLSANSPGPCVSCIIGGCVAKDSFFERQLLHESFIVIQLLDVVFHVLYTA